MSAPRPTSGPSLTAPGKAPDHEVILASAGTGKTFQLTSRFLSLIAAGESCDRVLATTFTRKAAGEILRKIVQRLEEGARSPESAATLGVQIGAPSLDPKACLRLLETVVRSLDRLSIGTIDSFFARLASGNVLASGGGREWRMVDEDEDALLRSEAVSQVLREGRGPELLDIIRGRNPGASRHSIHADLLAIVDQAYLAFLASDRSVWGGIQAPQPLGPREVNDAITALRAWDTPLNKNRLPNAYWTREKAKALIACEAGRWRDFVHLGLIARIIYGDKYYAGIRIEDDARDVLMPLITHAGAVLLETLERQTKSTWQVMALFDRAYRAIKESRGLCTFDDVPRMLSERAATQSSQEMYYRLDATLRHVLLDEFQDTSVMQWRLLLPLVEEIVSQGEDRSLLCVGDVKQSLYSWRQAEPDLLPGIPKRWTHVKTRTLDESYRSSPVVMDCVNQVMSGIDRNPGILGQRVMDGTREAIERWGEMFRPHTTKRTHLPGFCRLSVSGVKNKLLSEQEVAVRDAAARVKEIHAAAPHLSVGVLFRTRALIARMKLELHHLGVQASEEGGNPMADSPAVAAVLSLLTLADHPGNTAALFHVAASPLAAIAGIEYPSRPGVVAEIAAGIRLRLVSEGYAGVIERWVRRLAPDCSERDLARLGQLVSLAEHFDERSRLDPATRPSAFVEFVRRRRVEDPSAARVRLMTIHASKGLEFHTVVLPWLGDPIARRAPAILLDRPANPLDPPTRVTLCPPKAVVALSPELSRMYERWRARETLEELCVLYVALTRAVHSIEMFVPPDEKAIAEHAGTTICFARIIRGVLSPGPAAPGHVLWTHGDPDWAAKVPPDPTPSTAPDESSTRPAIPTVRLDTSPASRSRLLPRRAPAVATTHAAATGYWPGLDESASALSRARGILFHAWLATIEWLDAGFPREADLLDLAGKLELPVQADAEALAAEFLEIISRPSIRALLTRPHAVPNVEVRREAPFAAGDGQGGIIVGRMDRLVITRDASGALHAVEVIDFKTDRLDDPSLAGLRAHADVYRGQMADYRATAARMLNCAVDRVSAKLVFLSHDAIVGT